MSDESPQPAEVNRNPVNYRIPVKNTSHHTELIRERNSSNPLENPMEIEAPRRACQLVKKKKKNTNPNHDLSRVQSSELLLKPLFIS